MKLGLVGRKVGMTQIFDNKGSLLPVSIVKIEPCCITQIKTTETDGYNAIQIGYTAAKSSKITKPIKGHLKKATENSFRYFKEFRVPEIDEKWQLGMELALDQFEIGQSIKVTGTSIGKGFTGNQKRNNFSRGPMTHGSKNHRLPGSIGAGTTPGRVYPGKKMAGQMGNKTVTLKNTEIVYLNETEKLLILKGSVPGKKDSFLTLTAK